MTLKVRLLLTEKSILKRLTNIVVAGKFVMDQWFVYLNVRVKKQIGNERIDKETQNIVAGNNGKLLRTKLLIDW